MTTTKYYTMYRVISNGKRSWVEIVEHGDELDSQHDYHGTYESWQEADKHARDITARLQGKARQGKVKR